MGGGVSGMTTRGALGSAANSSMGSRTSWDSSIVKSSWADSHLSSGLGSKQRLITLATLGSRSVGRGAINEPPVNRLSEGEGALPVAI